MRRTHSPAFLPAMLTHPTRERAGIIRAAVAVALTLLAVWAATLPTSASLGRAAAIVTRTAHILGVAGPDSGAVVLSGTIDSSGFRGHARVIFDLKRTRFAVFEDASYASLTYGFDGTAAWSRDTSGLVRNETFPPTRESLINQAYIWSGRLWDPTIAPLFHYLRVDSLAGQSVDVLRVAVPQGRPMEVWVSRESGLPVRYLQKNDMRIEVLDVSDYRNLGARVIPFKISTEELGNHALFQASAANFESENAAMSVERPQSSNHDSVIDGADKTVVPFSTQEGVIVLHVYLNGLGPFRVAFSTGAENILDPSMVRRLNIKAYGGAIITGGSSQSVIRYATIRTMRFGRARLADQSFIILKMTDVLENAQKLGVSGIVGYEILARFNATIDFKDKLLTLSRHSRLGSGIPISFFGNLPVAKGIIDGDAGWFMVTTGGKSGLILAQSVASKHPGAILKPVVALDNVTLDGTPVVLSKNARGIFGSPFLSGIVGLPALSRHRVLFDYADQLLEIK